MTARGVAIPPTCRFWRLFWSKDIPIVGLSLAPVMSSVTMTSFRRRGRWQYSPSFRGQSPVSTSCSTPIAAIRCLGFWRATTNDQSAGRDRDRLRSQSTHRSTLFAGAHRRARALARSDRSGPQGRRKMSETLAAVKGLDVIVERFSPHRLTLPDEPSSARMLRLLGAAEISPAPPPTDFLENVRRNLVAGSSSGKFSPRDLRYAPWLLWNGNPPAATLAGLLSKLLDQASTSGKTLRRLIEVYLRDFDPHAPGINEAAAKIRRELEKGGPLLDTWCVAQEEVKLFDPTRGPTSLAACLLEPGEQIQEILTRYK